MLEQLTFSWAEPLANHSLSQDLERDLRTDAAISRLPMRDWLTKFARAGSSGKTSLASCHQTADGTFQPSRGRWLNSGMGSPSECWTLNSSEFPSDVEECFLSDILETGDLPERYFLSPRACRGILRRLEKRGRSLSEDLRSAFEKAAMDSHLE